jgi:hypothetical protein
MALLTVVPLVGFPMLFGMVNPSLGPLSLRVIFVLLLVTGPIHVGSSAFFYADRDFKTLLQENRVRCLWSLGLLPAGLLGLGIFGVAAVGAWAVLGIFAFQYGWLFYHYQRQNFGLISLVSVHSGAGSLPRDVGVVLNVVALAGIVSIVGVPNLPPPQMAAMISHDAHIFMRWFSLALYVLSCGLLVRVFFMHARFRQDPWLAASLLLGWAFFLPAVACDAPSTAFIPLAVAHGAQYLLMMTVMSGRSGRGWFGVALAGLLGTAIGCVLDRMTELPAFFAATGLVQVHFLLDAKVWRLREPQQRAIISRRFDFLLAR